MKTNRILFVFGLVNALLLGGGGYVLSRMSSEPEGSAPQSLAAPQPAHPGMSLHWAGAKSAELAVCLSDLGGDGVGTSVAGGEEAKPGRLAGSRSPRDSSAAQARGELRRGTSPRSPESFESFAPSPGEESRSSGSGERSGHSGIDSAEGWPERADSATSRVGQSAAVVPQARTPAALLDPSPDLNLNAQQLAQWAELRQSFVDAVGGPNQSPADPAYLQRWQQAQPDNDERFKMLFGWQAFLQQQLLALQESGGPDAP